VIVYMCYHDPRTRIPGTYMLMSVCVHANKYLYIRITIHAHMHSGELPGALAFLALDCGREWRQLKSCHTTSCKPKLPWLIHGWGLMSTDPSVAGLARATCWEQEPEIEWGILKCAQTVVLGVKA